MHGSSGDRRLKGKFISLLILLIVSSSFTYGSAGTFFADHDGELMIKRPENYPDSFRIELIHDLDHSIYIMDISMDSIMLPLPLYSESASLLISSSDSIFLDTLLTGYTAYQTPQFEFNLDMPYSVIFTRSNAEKKASIDMEFQAFGQDGFTKGKKYSMIANMDSLSLAEFMNFDSLRIRFRWSTAIKWGRWSEWFMLNLAELNLPPYTLEAFNLPDSILEASDKLKLPAFADPEGMLSDTVFLIAKSLEGGHIIHSRILSRDSISLHTVLPDSLPDNMKWQFSIYGKDERNTYSDTVPSGIFYYNIRNDAPLSGGYVETVHQNVIGRPFTISWNTAIDPDPADSISEYTLNLTRDAQGYELLRQYRTSGKMRELAIDGPLPENTWLYAHLYARDTHGRISASDSLRLYIDLLNDPPGRVEYISSADTLFAGEKITWISVRDVNKEDTLLYYRADLRDSNDSLVHSETLVFPGDSIAELSIDLPLKLMNHDLYGISITVNDSSGGISRSRDTVYFHYSNGRNAIPAVPFNLRPAITMGLDSSGSVYWQPGIDDDGDKLVYDIEFSAIASFDTVNFQIETIADTFLLLNDIHGFTEDDTWYFWRVRSKDGWGGISDWSVMADFFYNREPDAPYWEDFLIKPESGNVFMDSSITFRWQGLVDPDFNDIPDSLSYLIQFTGDTLVKDGYPTFSPTNVITVETANMEENALYFFRIRGEDQSGLRSDWTEWRHFFVNLENEAPSSPEIFLPEVHQVLPMLGQIGWTAGKDPDPFDEVSYDLLFSIDKNHQDTLSLIENIRKSHLSPYASTYHRISRWSRSAELQNSKSYIYYQEGLEYRLPAGREEVIVQLNLFPQFRQLPENHLIYFSLTAKDREGKKADRLDNGSFWLNTRNEAPAAVEQIVFPADSQILKDPDVRIFWKAALDPDPGTADMDIHYQIELYQNGAIILRDSTRSGISSWQMPIPGEENAAYHYRIRAVDETELAGPWSDTATFMINSIPEAPMIPEEHLSINDSTIYEEAFPAISWKEIKHVDPGSLNDPLKAEVQIHFPDHNDERIYTFDLASNHVSEYSFRDSLPFYDNSWGFFKIRLIRADSIMSPWSRNIRFGNDFYAEPPSSFSIKEPEFGQDTLRTRPTFKWTASRDPDLNENLMYTIFISEDSSFYNDVMVIDGLYGTEYQLGLEDELYDNTRYFWKICVEDRSGNRAWGSQSDFTPWWFNVGEVFEDGKNGGGSANAVFYPLQPNPFSDKLEISFYLPYYSNCELEVYNLRGQKVAVLFREMKNKGEHKFIWDLDRSGFNHLSAGIYLFILKVDKQILRLKGILIK